MKKQIDQYYGCKTFPGFYPGKLSGCLAQFREFGL